MPFLDELGETSANDDVAQDWKNVIHSSAGWREQYSGINVSLQVFFFWPNIIMMPLRNKPIHVLAPPVPAQ